MILKLNPDEPLHKGLFKEMGKIARQLDRSLALAELDPSRIRLTNFAQPGEDKLDVEVRVKRAWESEKFIPLHLGWLNFFFNHQDLIPEQMKLGHLPDGRAYQLHFDGTIIDGFNGTYTWALVKSREVHPWGTWNFGGYKCFGDEMPTANFLSVVYEP